MASTYLYGDHVHANGIRQHYLRFGGKGRKLLVVPGITSPAVTWAEFAERLGQSFDTYVLDVRGRGLSSAGPDVDYGISALAEDVAAFAAALHFERYGLLGHSMGARIAPAAVARHGARPFRLMMVDPPVTGPGRRGHDNDDSWFTEQIEKGAHGGMTADEMRPYFPRWTDAQLQLRCEWIHTCDARAIVQFRKDVLVDDLHSAIPEIKVPMSVVIGGQSNLITVDEEQELKSLNALVETIRLPEAGHMVPWDEPERFNEIAVQFFSAD